MKKRVFGLFIDINYKEEENNFNIFSLICKFGLRDDIFFEFISKCYLLFERKKYKK